MNITPKKPPQHRSRRLAPWVIASTLAPPGCSPDAREDGPHIIIVQIKRRWAGPDECGKVPAGPPKICECYQLRSPAGADISEFQGLFKTNDRTNCSEPQKEDCAAALDGDDLQAGWDSLHVIVDYQPLVLDFGQDIAAPMLTLRVDGVDKFGPAPLSVPGLTDPDCVSADAGAGSGCSRRSWPYAHGRVALASELPAGALAVHVKADSDYFNAADVAPIAPPKLGLYFEPPGADDARPATCEPTVLIADQTRVFAVALVPTNWSSTPAVTLEQRLDQAWASRDLLTGPSPVGEAAELRRPLIAPGAVNDLWELTLSSGIESTTKTLMGTLQGLAITPTLACDGSTDCQAPVTCELVGGLDHPLFTVSIPDEAAPQEAQVTITFGGVAGSPIPIPLTTLSEDQRSGVAPIAVPAGTGDLRVTAQVGESTASVCATVKPPADLELSLAVSDATPLPALDDGSRIATEPRLDCRTVYLWVAAPSLANDGVAMVSAGPGASFAGDSAAVVHLDQAIAQRGRRGVIEVLLDNDDPTIDALKFSATVGEQTRKLLFPLAPLYPRGDAPSAALSANPDAQTVGVDGTKPIVVTGFVYGSSLNEDPKQVMRFAPGTRLYVQTKKVAPGMPPLCGKALTPAEIDCDPQALDNGGCKLAPRLVDVTPTGEFAFNIPAGLCLSGTVELTLRGSHYPPDDPNDPDDNKLCIGSRALIEQDPKDPTRSPVLATAELTFN